MANQMMRFGLVRTVRLVVAVIATIAFGGLMTHSPAARAATDPVTYVLNAIDIYGNPIEAPFNQKTIVDDKDPHASSLDVSEIIPTSLDDGRYNLYGYHTDNKSGQQVMYYNDLVKGSKPIADKLKAINVSNPQRNPANKTVNLYFAYRDAQSKKPAQITLTDDALQREAGKVKFFFTDVDGNPMREPLKYDFANVPSLNGIFEDDIGNYRYTAAVVRNPKPYGTYVYSNSKIFAHMKTNVDDLLWESILQPAYMNGFAKGPKQKWDNGSTVTFIYEKIKNTLTIEYVDEAGDSISGHPARRKT
ncbi:hypothetical protein [Lentilactobacillus rapi]|uniref:hypothetical protein n=1 Tax=Lentilactobacillus rapi TaxID=481723 RepID=UPI0006D16F23|nr:hypothetical protein [Lentilactobacillus rapi]